ncbi:Glycerol-3-phosphate/dihydroxyacetone phosphate acyltransferase [Taxawa tesnikishii (nom. ined.)]|nr:Glycerol-3-phosphate/dihydroxyacetone phosphate acyltransferase [Dothideales sp. JES 119]
MALGALEKDPDCGVKIVPCGMNYFHAHKFRSRAVVEFGTPVEIPKEVVEMYKRGERREAIAWVLDTVYQALVTVTVTSPDYDTLMLIQAVRRLYNPKGKKLPLPMIVELNRRLVKGYTTYKDDPLKKNILAYNRQLFQLNIRDHQLSYAKFSIGKVIFTLLYRLGKLAVLSTAVLPGTVLFAPVFIAGKVISIKKSREALAASTVKIQGRDVMATWKLLVSMALAPILYTWYTFLFTYWTYRNRAGGRVPEWVPLWGIVLFGYVFFPAISFASLRFGEIGMDIVKSLRPLLLSLNPQSSNSLVKLREQRAVLVEQVTDVINELGPELYPDFNHQRIIGDPFHPLSPVTLAQSPQFRRSQTAGAGIGGGSGHGSDQLPRNESFKNLSGIGLFASRPATPTGRSRSRTNSQGGLGSGGVKPMTVGGREGLSKDGIDQLGEKIRGAMRERGRRRKSGSDGDGGWDFTDGAEMPVTDFEPGGGKEGHLACWRLRVDVGVYGSVEVMDNEAFVLV